MNDRKEGERVMIAKLILFGSLAMVAYVYAGYPLMLWVFGQFRRRKTHQTPFTPSISVIIAAFNEEKVISSKLDNTLALDYPQEKLEILVASDGSTDATEEIAKHYGQRGVRLFRLGRCGKMRALEYSASKAFGEILVFTDANTWISPLSLRKLASHFSDSSVGGVCGRKRIGRKMDGGFAVLGEGIYWRYDQLLKILESRVGSTIAADGSLYAIRRELFKSSDDPAQADDIAISIQIPMQGKYLAFERDAQAWEAPPASAECEFWRKIRVANHAFRSFWNFRAALNPLHTGFYAIELWSHKILRYFVPFPLVIAFFANLLLAGSGKFYSLMLWIQILFYLLVFSGAVFRNSTIGRSPFLHTPFYFCLAHSAALLGVFSALRGKRIIAWKQERTTSGLTADGKEFV